MLKQTSSRRGFVLLVTLLLIGVAAMALAGVSRAGLRRVMDARRAQEDLQRRWGVLTCQSALLGLAPTILTNLEEEQLKPVARVRATFSLTDQRFDVVLGDEQAKVDCAALLARVGRAKSDDLVRDLLRAQGCDEGVRMRPLPVEDDALPELGSYAQILPNASAQALFAESEDKPAPIDYLTCWGNEKLNYLRAQEPVVRTFLSGLLSRLEVNALISQRDEIPDLKLPELLKLLDLTEAKRKPLEQVLTDRSAYYSVRITTVGNHRIWRDLAIIEQAGAQQGEQSEQGGELDNGVPSDNDKVVLRFSW